MNFDLSKQLYYEYEELRKRLEQPAEPAWPLPDLVKENIKLKELNVGLQEKARRAEATAQTADQKCKGLDIEIKRLQGDLAKMDEALEKYRINHSRYSKTLEELKKKYAKTVDELNEKHASELDLKKKSIDQLSKERDLKRNELKTLELKLKKCLSNHSNTSFVRLQADLERIASLPLRMRLVALFFDLLLLVAGVNLVVRYNPAWDTPGNFGTLLVPAFAAFSFRTFASPGRWLLGISPRHIGREFRPTGPAGFAARFVCGIAHYGPLIASLWFLTGYQATRPMDTATNSAVSKLSRWIDDPSQSKQTILNIALDFFDPRTISLPKAVVGLTLAWAGGLLASLLLSRWLYASAPFFRNTTLIETMCRVGFQRFDWPDSANSDVRG